MAEYSQMQRCIKILQLLSTHKYVTTSQLEERFRYSVSRRTLQRDLLLLSDAGIPLMTEKVRANENAWSVMDSFKQFIPIPLESNEYLALQLLRSNLSLFKKTEIQSDVEKLIHKIDQLLPQDLFIQSTKEQSQDLLTSFHLGHYDYSGKDEIVQAILSGMMEKRKCLVIYDAQMSGDEKGFYVEPEKFLTYQGGLYVIVYIRNLNEFRLLAVHRIMDWQVYEEHFPDDHAFDEKKFMDGRFGLFSGDSEKIKLKFNKSVRHYIEHKHWHPSQKFSQDKKGNLIMELEVPITPELISWIMGWHVNVRVVQPIELKNEVIANVVEINELYKIN